MLAASALSRRETASVQHAPTVNTHTPNNSNIPGTPDISKDAANDNNNEDALSGLLNMAYDISHSLASWIKATCEEPEMVQAEPKEQIDRANFSMQLFEAPSFRSIFNAIGHQEMAPA